jgi:hypothetical protein
MFKMIAVVLLIAGSALAYETGPEFAESASIAGTGTISMDVGNPGWVVEGFLTCVSGSVTFTMVRDTSAQVYPISSSGDAFVTVLAGETMPFKGKIEEISITSLDGGGSDVKMVSYR